MLLFQDNISMLFLLRGTLFSPNGLANHSGATGENKATDVVTTFSITGRTHIGLLLNSSY
jgi:hypothetical protein